MDAFTVIHVQNKCLQGIINALCVERQSQTSKLKMYVAKNATPLRVGYR